MEVIQLLKDRDPYGIYEIYEHVLPLIVAKIDIKGVQFEFELPINFINIAREGLLKQMIRTYYELGILSLVEPSRGEYDPIREHYKSPNGTMYYCLGDRCVEISKDGMFFQIYKTYKNEFRELFGIAPESKWIIKENTSWFASLNPIESRLNNCSIKWWNYYHIPGIAGGSKRVSVGLGTNKICWRKHTKKTWEDVRRKAGSCLIVKILSRKCL